MHEDFSQRFPILRCRRCLGSRPVQRSGDRRAGAALDAARRTLGHAGSRRFERQVLRQSLCRRDRSRGIPQNAVSGIMRGGSLVIVARLGIVNAAQLSEMQSALEQIPVE